MIFDVVKIRAQQIQKKFLSKKKSLIFKYNEALDIPTNECLAR